MVFILLVSGTSLYAKKLSGTIGVPDGITFTVQLGYGYIPPNRSIDLKTDEGDIITGQFGLDETITLHKTYSPVYRIKIKFNDKQYSGTVSIKNLRRYEIDIKDDSGDESPSYITGSIVRKMMGFATDLKVGAYNLTGMINIKMTSLNFALTELHGVRAMKMKGIEYDFDYKEGKHWQGFITSIGRKNLYDIEYDAMSNDDVLSFVFFEIFHILDEDVQESQKKDDEAR